ncbi:MAG: response regulator transcription factor [Flavobacteriales bacterium]|nr:response regulator transcription factor [Flavobacteriales bacterium]
MIEIILADDHALITEGISTMLQDASDMEVVATFQNGQEVLRYLQIRSVDLVILDIDMPVLDGIETAKAIVANHPGQKFAILTMHDEHALIKSFVTLGASGYFLKTIDKDELELAIRQIVEGRTYFPIDVVTALADSTVGTSFYRQYDLTSREIEIITLLSDGLSNKQIGEKIHISPRTVDTHRTNIMRKLDVSNVAGIIRFAYKSGLVKP